MISEGTVLQVTTAAGYAQRTGSETAARTLWWIVALFLLLPVLFTMFIIGLFFPSRPGPSLLPRVGERVASYWCAGRLLHLDPVPVQDIRVRETYMGRIRLVRVAGYLAGGGLAPGDRVLLSGPDYHGTVLFREGFNFTTQSEIILR